jgi:hypothetical protein
VQPINIPPRKIFNVLLHLIQQFINFMSTLPSFFHVWCTLRHFLTSQYSLFYFIQTVSLIILDIFCHWREINSPKAVLIQASGPSPLIFIFFLVHYCPGPHQPKYVNWPKPSMALTHIHICSHMVGQSSGMLPTRISNPGARNFSWDFPRIYRRCVLSG